jgi:hypothetical protein
MASKQWACSRVAATALVVGLAILPSFLDSASSAAPAIEVKSADIGGVVTGINGPEAGVWVIGETMDLPTKFVRIVVTDDQGRYLIPDLPSANYTVWVRGYGLVDSPKLTARPGQTLDLKAVEAPNARAAAQYYPASYWYSMLHVPDASKFPGTGAGPNGNGIPVSFKDQGQWMRYLKTDGCESCHQLGDKATRTIEPQLGHFKSDAEAWERRIQSGQPSSLMVNAIGRFGAVQLALQNFGNWTTRIANGELPKTKPPRPSGIERNIVITEWDWAKPTDYEHDEIATARTNPTVNAYGRIYGSPASSSDYVPWVDPVHNTTGFLKSVYRDPNTPTTATNPMFAPSPYWGRQVVWDSHTNVHNPMFGNDGRLWLTAVIRGPNNPAWCRAGSKLPSAEAYPLSISERQLEVYNPKTGKIDMIDICSSTHHLQFDKSGVLWFSQGGARRDAIGWLDVSKWDKTHNEQTSQGWSPFVLDTNANGKRDPWVEPNQPVDPKKDKRIATGLYGVAPNPVDGSIWGSTEGFPGGVVRFDPKTQLSEYYEVPWKDPRSKYNGFGPRGFAIDTNGVAWVTLASGQLARFDRSKCEGPLNGPKATGKQCPEGWTIYDLPAPHFENAADQPGSIAEAPYYPWVDQFDTFGLGKNVAIATGNLEDSLEVLKDGKFVTLRVPYPMGFFVKGLDGRIDDANAGWKGRGLWSAYSQPATHIEGGKGQTSKVVHFQLRPSPLAD